MIEEKYFKNKLYLKDDILVRKLDNIGYVLKKDKEHLSIDDYEEYKEAYDTLLKMLEFRNKYGYDVLYGSFYNE